MGYFSDLDIEFRQQNKSPNIADAIGLSYEELLDLEYEFITEKTKDNKIKSYKLILSENTPNHIKNKIINLEDDLITVYIEPYELNFGSYYQYELESMSENDRHFDKFNSEINNLVLLSKIETKTQKLKDILLRQIFIGVIGSLETFLSEVFIVLTLSNKKYLENFVATFPDFQKSKFTLSEIFTQHDKISETTNKAMLDIIYHNLPVVRNMYNSTFGINFPEIGDVNKFIVRRHDLVHRNGKTKDGGKITINNVEIESMVEVIKTFVNQISFELKLI
jgi:hypothetical protein